MRVSPLVILVGYGALSVHGVDTTSTPYPEATGTECEGLTKLCTGDAIISGSSLQLTYVCPITTEGSARTVTQTSTLTVTITPSVEVTVTKEPITTTTITSDKSTHFITKTVSLARSVSTMTTVLSLPESSGIIKIPGGTTPVVEVPSSTTDGIILTSSAPVTMSTGYAWPTSTVDLFKPVFPTMTVSGTSGVFFTRTQANSSYLAIGTGSLIATGTGTYFPTGTFSTSATASMVTSLEPAITVSNEISILPIFPLWTNSSMATVMSSSSAKGYAIPTMTTSTAPAHTFVLPTSITFHSSINTVLKRADTNTDGADTTIYTTEYTPTTTTTVTIYPKKTTTVPTGSVVAPATATPSHKPDSITKQPGAVTQHLGTNSANTACASTMMATLLGLAAIVFARA